VAFEQAHGLPLGRDLRRAREADDPGADNDGVDF
jgi:hypothetical protein